jgi:hypothetical protein
VKRTFLIVTLIALLAVAAVPGTIQQLNDLRSIPHGLAAINFWGSLLTVYAREEEHAQSVRVEYAPTVEPAAQNEFRWNGRVASGRGVEIKGVNGNVRAEGYTGSEVEVVATKRARRSNPDEVRIQVIEHADGVTICAVYPSSDTSRPNQCQPGKGGHMNVNNNDVEVNFIVRVPMGVRFIGRTVNGEVEAESIGSDVEAYTVNGSINVSATGLVQAGTVNGSIRAAMGSANWTSPLEFETVNGGITLDLPSGLNTEVRAETLNGDISTDFPLMGQTRTSRRRMSGTIGTGGRELVLKTINGSIKLRRAS